MGETGIFLVALLAIGVAIERYLDPPKDEQYIIYKNKLEKLADQNHDGDLSLYERVVMLRAMGIQDQPDSYQPTKEEIKKGIAYFEEYH